jgi:hypothetical protein
LRPLTRPNWRASLRGKRPSVLGRQGALRLRTLTTQNRHPHNRSALWDRHSLHQNAFKTACFILAPQSGGGGSRSETEGGCQHPSRCRQEKYPLRPSGTSPALRGEDKTARLVACMFTCTTPSQSPTFAYGRKMVHLKMHPTARSALLARITSGQRAVCFGLSMGLSEAALDHPKQTLSQ